MQLIDHKAFGTPLSDNQLDDIGGGIGHSDDCGVPEGQFPNLGKCYNKGNSILGTVYKKVCPYCSIWSSLPEGTNLAVTYILECTLHGYGKRIKE